MQFICTSVKHSDADCPIFLAPIMRTATDDGLGTFVLAR